jgi:single-strand DNA-binding protein
MGRLVKDVELKTTANGVSVISFTVAVDKKYKQGEEKQADFIDIIAWRGTAEFINKYFRKGQMIAVQGSIQTRMYEDKSGKKCKAVEIVADEVSFCGDKNNGAAPVTPTITPSDDEGYRDIPEDDLPF